MKTIEEWLREIPDPEIAALALKHCMISDTGGRRVETLRRALLSAFEWKKTPEGHYFWEKVSTRNGHPSQLTHKGVGEGDEGLPTPMEEAMVGVISEAIEEVKSTLPPTGIVELPDENPARYVFTDIGAVRAEDPKKASGDLKPQLVLMPPSAEEDCCAVLALGSKKYGPYNWRDTGVQLPTYISAIKRHLAAAHRGEWIDPESGKPHIAHIMASCAIMLDADEHGKLDKQVMPHFESRLEKNGIASPHL